LGGGLDDERSEQDHNPSVRVSICLVMGLGNLQTNKEGEKNMYRILISIFLLLFVLTGSAVAGDIVATWKYSDGSTFKLSARDDQHVRMDTAEDSYTLLTDGKVYMVQKDDDGWQATDTAQMASMMGGIGGAFGQQKAASVEDYKTTYKYTGKTETIAGYKGKVYRVEVRDSVGKLVSSDDLVFSKSKDIRRINMAMVQISSKMTSGAMPGMAKSADAAKRQADKYGSVLRYGKDMTLTSVKKASLKSAYFELPKGTTQSEVKAPKKAPQKTTAAANEKTAGKKGGFLGDLFKSTEGAAKDQTKTNTTGEVKESVNKMFNKFFKKE